MKRSFICFCLILCLMLCGCTRAAEYREPEQVIITAALGFDNAGGKLCVSAETVNTKADADYEPQVIKGKGVTVEQVLQSISDTLGGELFLGHCATVVLGNSLTEDQVKDIIQFCKDNIEISLAIKLVTAENAAELLSCKSYSGEAVGYDIIKLLTTKGDIAAPDSYAGLFRIENLRSGENESFTLPCLLAEQSEDGLVLSPNGADVFSGALRTYRLTKEQDTLLKILTNSFSGGTLTLETENGVLQAGIEKSRCKINKDIIDDGLSIDCAVTLTVERDGFKGENISEFGKQVEGLLKDFFTLMQTEIKEDILHITDSIQKYQPLIYKKIANDPLGAFSDAAIKVTCTVKGGDRQ